MAERKIFAGGEFLVTDTAAKDVFILEEMTREHKMIYAAAFDFVKKEIRPNMERINEKNEELPRHL